jgi:hypothetical protein
MLLMEDVAQESKEAQMARKLALIVLCIALVSILCLNSSVNRGSAFSMVSAASAQNCNPQDNMGETAQSFAGRCCKGSIKSVFPGQYWDKTLKEIDADCTSGGRRYCDDDDAPSASSIAAARTAWKLLKSNEYRK